MKEKQRAEQPKPAGSPDSIFDGVPDLPENKNVTVSSGPYSEELPVAGTSVGEIRRKFKDRLDIDDQAQAIVNGKNADENTTLNAGEALMFIRHAGEKGGYVLEAKGNFVRVDGSNTSMEISTLLERCGPGISTGEVILPTGVKTILSRGNLTIWIWEEAPRIRQFQWIAEGSPNPYGPGTKYRKVRIALPYLIIAAVFARDDKGLPKIIGKDECFFRTEPLKSLDDELCYPALLNCSRWPDGDGMGHPLSWICTQHLKKNPLMKSLNPGDRFQGGFEAVRYCLLETGFNLSSEHHEGNSWYGASKMKVKGIAPIEEWEKQTNKDPLFVLDLPWIKTNHSVRQLADRIFTQNGNSAGAVKNADDLARLILNQ